MESSINSFDVFWLQIVSGIANGCIYASVALALVMIYQATRLINFAQGEMATFSTYVAWSLMAAGVPYWAAFVITVAGSFVLGATIERVVIRPMGDKSMLAVVVVFIGIMVIFNSSIGLIWGHDVKQFASPFEGLIPANRFISSHQLGAALVSMTILLALYAFLRFTPLGLSLRAAALNPASSRLVGIRVGWMLTLGWGLAAAIGAVAGMMMAPAVYLEPNMMAGVLLYAFAGALLGGIENPWGAVCGGLLVGIVEVLAGAYVIGTELRLTIALVLIIGVLMIKPAGIFGRRSVARV
ncbi:branched-chain amino acid ABC transporter permease [Variovorax sp. GB1P17]|uniref:branched-chain amino acid ABC transporter permease n=1 Tax=Variovorax sp. GB1P17 TaxID=3443740 RepID=UPI003F4861AF